MKQGTIIIDLDGTAVDTPKQKLPTPRLVAAVAQLQADWHICAATGRSFSWAMDLIGPMGLRDLCIISGGTSLVDPISKQLVWRKSMDGATIRQVLPIMEQSGARVLADDYTEAEYWQGRPFSTIRDLSEAYFLELVFVRPDKAEAIMQQLANVEGICALLINSQKSGTHDIHIMNKEATKEQAVAELYRRLGADPTQSIGVGDGHNDLHLFNAVAHKVAMGNSIQEIKDAADETIGPVQDDGLAAYFEHLSKNQSAT